MDLQTWTEIHCWREGDVMDTPMSHAHFRCSPKCHRSLRVNSCDTHSQSRFLGVGGGPRAASSFSCRPVTHRGRRRHNRPSCSACHSRQAGLSAQNKVLTGDGWNANVLLEMNASSHRNWSNRHIESLSALSLVFLQYVSSSYQLVERDFLVVNIVKEQCRASIFAR